MKTPVMLSLSALVVLGHWLVLGPGPDTLARWAAPAGSVSTAPAAPVAWPASTSAMLPASDAQRLEQPARASLQAFTLWVNAPAPVSANMPREVAGAAKAAVQAKPSERERPDAPTTSGGSAQASGPGQRQTQSTQLANTGSAAAQAAQTSVRAAEPSATSSAAPSSAPGSAPGTAPNDTLVSADSRSAGAERAPQGQVPQTSTREGDALAAAPAQALPAWLLERVQLPAPAQVKYDIDGQVRGLNYRAAAVLAWQQGGDRYDARMVVTAFLVGSRTMHSQGAITADGLAPTRFGDKTRSEQAAHFQPDKGKISFSANTPDVPWQRGAQDRLSVFFQLAGMLAGQPERFTAGTVVPVLTASARGAQTWAFQVEGRETLRLPVGELPVLKLSRPALLERDQLVEIWFAPSLAYWPVRIKLSQRNGDFVDQQLASLPVP